MKIIPFEPRHADGVNAHETVAGLLVQLNADWRVSDDPPQWALQQRMRKPQPGKSSGWEGRKYIRDRDHLLRRIGELCGKVEFQSWLMASKKPWISASSTQAGAEEYC